MRRKKNQKPGKSASTLSVVKAAVSTVPVLGGPLAEFLELIFRPAIERRRDEFLHDLAASVEAIDDRLGPDGIAGLEKNDAFITAAVQAVDAALRTSSEERRAAFRNAALNAAIDVNMRTAEADLLLGVLDQLTEWHIRILRFLDDPEEVRVRQNVEEPNWLSGGTHRVLERVFPELADVAGIHILVLADLYRLGLTTMPLDASNGLGVVVGDQLLPAGYTTELAQRLLRFIASPGD